MQQVEYFLNKIVKIDALSGLRLLPNSSISCLCSSPPYWALRSYLPNDDINKKYELGQEPTFKEYINNLIEIYKEAYRVLKDDGCLFINLGDTYYGRMKGAGGASQLTSRKQVTNQGSYFEMDGKKFKNNELKDKCLCNIPYRFAIKMTDELEYIQRNLIIWYKPNKFPESCKDRFTVDFEPVLFFTKSKKYNFTQQFEPYSTKYNYNEEYTGQATKDYESESAQNPSDSKRRILESIKNGKGKNKRCVFKVNVKPTKYKHTATFPPELIEPLIKAGCPENEIVLDIFNGIATTSIVAKKLNRNFIGFEISDDFCKTSQDRFFKEFNQEIEIVRI